MDRIYSDHAAAVEACRQYNARLDALDAELGVWLENEDSCTEVYVRARYYDEAGIVRNVRTMTLE